MIPAAHSEPGLSPAGDAKTFIHEIAQAAHVNVGVTQPDDDVHQLAFSITGLAMVEAERQRRVA